MNLYCFSSKFWSFLFISRLVLCSSGSARRAFYLFNNLKNLYVCRAFVNRNEVNEGQTTRRCSQRKLNAALVKDKNRIPETNCLPKKKENLSWLLKSGAITHENSIAKCNSDRKVENNTTIKRCKRTLTLEKDKASPHSVKVLRRSHGQMSKDIKKNDGKLHLPSVKVNKSI